MKKTQLKTVVDSDVFSIYEWQYMLSVSNNGAASIVCVKLYNGCFGQDYPEKDEGLLELLKQRQKDLQWFSKVIGGNFHLRELGIRMMEWVGRSFFTEEQIPCGLIRRKFGTPAGTIEILVIEQARCRAQVVLKWNAWCIERRRI